MVAAVPIPIYEKQASFRQSTVTTRGFVGGRGTGKSTIGAIDLLMRARNKEPYMVVAPTYPQLDDSTYPAFIEAAENMKVLIREWKSGMRRVLVRTRDGGRSMFTFRSGDDPESLRGPTKAGVLLDEASLMSEDVYKICLPILRYRGKMGPINLTFTPRGPRHWTYNVFYKVTGPPNPGFDPPRKNTFLVQAHSSENPFLPPEYCEVIADQYSLALQEQELAGKFIEMQGLMFQMQWFNMVEAVPVKAHRVRYWDKAATQDAGCFTAGVLMARTPEGFYYVEDVVRGQWSADARNKVIGHTAARDAAKYQNNVHIWIEKEGGSGGKESSQILARQLAGHPVYLDNVSQGKHWIVRNTERLPGQAKIDRSYPFQAQAEAGNVKYLRGEWNKEWLAEMVGFPETKYADQVDGTSGAFNKLAALGGIKVQPASSMSAPRSDPRERFGIQILHRTDRKKARRC